MLAATGWNSRHDASRIKAARFTRATCSSVIGLSSSSTTQANHMGTNITLTQISSTVAKNVEPFGNPRSRKKLTLGKAYRNIGRKQNILFSSCCSLTVCETRGLNTRASLASAVLNVHLT